MKIFNIQETGKSRHKFGGTKVCKAGEKRKDFINPKIEIKVFSMNFLFIAYKNNEWCRFVVHIDSSALISFYYVCFASFYFFLFS